MSWAANRQTTKSEDEAYSLLGFFEVNLPIIYGEGERSFARLQEEIRRAYADQSIFAWLVVRSERRKTRHVYTRRQLAEPEYMDLLAKLPNDFQNCRDVIPIQQSGTHLDTGYELTERYIRFWLPIRPLRHSDQEKYGLRTRHSGGKIVTLNCCFESGSSTILTLVDAKAEGLDGTYFVCATDCDTVDRVHDWNTAWKSMKAWLNDPGQVPEQLRLMRTVNEYRSQLPLQAIFCGLRPVRDCTASVLRAEPEEL